MKTKTSISFENMFAREIIPANEKERLDALRAYNLLNTPPEESFQNLVHLMASHFRVPIALISLVDKEEVFFKANYGMEGVRRTSRGISLCSLAILSDEPTIISDPLYDPCLIANPLVHGAFGLRFYAAAPLVTNEGYRIGSVCIVDKAERSFSVEQTEQLKQFANVVIHEMDLRRSVQLREIALKKETEQRQRFITNAVIQAQERERTRLGLELHDNVSQMLTTVKLYTEIALDSSSNTREILQKSNVYLQECINEIRYISHQLSSPTLGDISINDSLAELAKSINRTGKIHVQVTIQNCECLHLREDFRLCIYRIVQEQLNNVLKYAEATTATILLQKTGSQLLLCIEDNGKGFNPSLKPKGIGLMNIKARTENFGGVLHIESAPGEGCRLRIHFPAFQTEFYSS